MGTARFKFQDSKFNDMTLQLFHGHLIRLAAPNADTDAETWAAWGRDSEFLRLLDSDAARPWSRQQAKKELEEEPKPHVFPFVIRTLADDRLVGFIGLWVPNWNQGDGWVGIGIGDRNDWGKGYGTDAMRVLLRYAFTEINLRRVSLGLFAYNPRAQRAYEKAGFVLEGRLRQAHRRDGQRMDELLMGILREEWEGKDSSSKIQGPN
jgi:RimJ/RimL family protein N-acetyltransferase